MITEAIPAWVIHKHWSGDTSARVIFFTESFGLVSALYKGGRTPKKQALVQAFLPLWLIMNVHKDAYYVRQLDMMASPMPLTGRTLFAGLYVNELLYHALKPLDPHPSLYVAYTETLKELQLDSNRLSMERVLRRFEWVLLSSCGYHLSFTHDATMQNPILSDRTYRFIAGEGFVLSDEGISGAHILAIAEDRLDDVSVLLAAKRIMRCAIFHAVDGKEFKARALYG